MGRSASPNLPSACLNCSANLVPGAVPVGRAVRRVSGFVVVGPRSRMPHAARVPVQRLISFVPGVQAAEP